MRTTGYILLRWIWIRIRFWPEPDPDPNKVCYQRSDPDPVQIGPDPQHCRTVLDLSSCLIIDQFIMLRVLCVKKKCIYAVIIEFLYLFSTYLSQFSAWPGRSGRSSVWRAWHAGSSCRIWASRIDHLPSYRGTVPTCLKWRKKNHNFPNCFYFALIYTGTENDGFIKR